MGKLLKILFGLVLTVILLVIAAAIIIPLVVDPNDFKGEIVQQVKQQTGDNRERFMAIFCWTNFLLVCSESRRTVSSVMFWTTSFLTGRS